jgi:phage anti-repressor protein
MAKIDINHLLAYVKNKLSDEKQKQFADQFALFFIDKTNPYPIEGNIVIQWLDYKKKDKFKTFMMKCLTENKDFIIEKVQTNGRPSDNFKISVDGFKLLSIKANTKVGTTLRSYHVELEKLIHQYIVEIETSQQIQNAHTKAQDLQLALDAEKENNKRYINRKIKKDEPGDYVYIFRESEFMHKIGQTGNVIKRENAHRTSSSSSRIVYTKKCCNRKLLEKVVHHILDQYRVNSNREWFEVSFEVAKTALDCAHLFLDGIIDKCDTLCSSGFYDKLKGLVDSLDKTAETTPPPPVCELPQNTKDPLNFEGFIAECCEQDPTYTAFTAEIYGAHRLWGRCCQKQTHDAFYKYLNANFKKAKIFDPNTNALLASYRGIRLKPFSYPKDDPISDIDNFIDAKCTLNYAARVSSKNIYSAFEAWKGITIPDYKINPFEKRRIDEAFSMKFVPSRVFTGSQGDIGFFCVALKDQPSVVGLKLAPTLRKPVAKIDINTKEVIEVFESLTAVAKIEKKSLSYMCVDVKYKRPHGNYLYQYIEKPKNEPV